MKKILSILISISVILSSFVFVGISVSADETYENFTYKILNDTEVEITGATSNDLELDIVVPKKIDDRTPIRIATNAFQYSKIKSFSAPTVTTVETTAFESCHNLTTVSLPSAIYFGREAFGNCSELTEFNFNENTQSIPNVLFYNCSKLEKVTLGNKLETIGENSFQNCTALKDIMLPTTVTIISRNAFSHCYSLKKSELNEGLEKIETNAFSECTELESISIPSTVKIIEDNAFDGCVAMTSAEIAEGVEELGRDIFSDCKSLKSIVLPNSVKAIPASAFYYCENLVSVTLGNQTETIGDNAFINCKALKSFTMPDTVTTVGKNIFEYCYELKDITLNQSLEEISENMFEYCSVLDNVVIPKSVTKIGSNAFNGCTDLKNITVPESVTEIGLSAFYNNHKDLVLSVKPNSFAETYAKENSLNYKYYCDDDHQFELTATIQPTCTNKGEKQYTCKICGEKKIEYFGKALGHKIIIKNESKATYFKTGYSGDKICSVCGNIIENGKTSVKLTIKKPSIKVTATKRKITVKCKKVNGATGYQIKYKIGKKTVTKNFNIKRALNKVFKKLKKGKCKVIVRAFVKSGNQIAYSAPSSKTVKIK